MGRRAQATLEFTLAFVIIVALIASLFIMWKWSTDNIVKRQKWYSGSRVQAGSIAPTASLKEMPVVPPTAKKLEDSDMVYPENK